MLSFMLNAVSEGEKTKFERLYMQYKDLMMHISLKILKKKELAEESVQESLIKMLLKIDNIGEITCHKTKGWVVVISERTAYDKLKYEKRRIHISDEVLEYTDFNDVSTEDVTIRNMTLAKVSEALNKLDEKYSDVIVLKYYFGYSAVELAKLFSVSPEVIRKRCERGKKMILNEISKMGGDCNE